MDNWKRFPKTSLSYRKAFYSELYLKDITDEDYAHAQKVFEGLKFKNLGDYHDLYVQSDILLLPDAFQNLRNKCIKIYELHFLSAPGLAWKDCSEKAGVELELLTDIVMLLMVEKGIPGGMCHAIHRYPKANNKYRKNYDISIISSYIIPCPFRCK